MSNINTLKSLKDGKKKPDDVDDNQQAFYAGGSDRCGQEILGPPSRDSDDIIRDIFKSAKDAGAQQLEHEDEDLPPSSPASSFPGQGFRLDSQPGQSSQSSQADKPEEVKKEKKNVLRKLRLWKNGFSIDDGELRDYNTPENAEFLACVKRGEVPRELVNDTRGVEGPSGISINISNHSHEDFVPPKKTVKAFTGEGQRLGNVTPQFSSFSQPSLPESNKTNEDEAAKQLKTDKEKPTTRIQVRLADGTKLIVVMNLTHTINDLRMYIVTSRPNYAASPFILSTSFPPKELTDEGLTIEVAKLQGAVVIQKFKV